MGHLVGKDIYRSLGKKIDNLTVRAPWNDTLYAILKELYSVAEAEVVVKMPYSLANLERIAQLTGQPVDRLRPLIDSLCDKGLILDLWIEREYFYMPSPMVIGIFEFTLMRTGPDLDTPKLAKLFHHYLSSDRTFVASNFDDEKKISIMRSLPYEEAARGGEYLEILDYERADALIEASDRFAIGLCSCRHEKLHASTKQCDVPLESCTTFGFGADYLIRHNLAREISRAEMRDHFVRSRELGLVLNADNVQKNISFVCHCCKCCCNPLLGIRLLGYPHCIVTSSFIAAIDHPTCTGCGQCLTACPVDAISMAPISTESPSQVAIVDNSICLGCGVCCLKCKPRACRLKKRTRQVIHPETTFERIMLQCLERGTLQNQIFDNPQSLTHQFMRGFIGGFLKLPPIKRALMSDKLRSRFLAAMKKGASQRGKSSIIDM